VPGDVALAGFDDIVFAQEVYPPLTSVHMPAREMGRRAAQFLFERIENPDHEQMQEVLPTELVVRSSTVAVKGGR